MPILNVKIGAAKKQGLGGRVATTLLELTASVLGKDPRLTSIAIDWVDPSDWFVGGRSLAEQDKTSFYFDIRITDESNTKDEKARYLREVFAAMRGLLGDLHEESYVHVMDVRAGAYGYGGLTQEYRYQHK